MLWDQLFIVLYRGVGNPRPRRYRPVGLPNLNALCGVRSAHICVKQIIGFAWDTDR